MEYGIWIGLFTFIGMFLFLMLGIPIFICLLTAAFLGSWLVGGSVYTLHQFSSAFYYIASTYNFAVVPLFILMSVLGANSGIAQGAYDSASKWMGQLRGGLLMATIGGAAIFAASCGSSLASAAVFSRIAMPELNKYKYNEAISVGCIAGAGSLASLIPPSVGIIIVCIIVDASIGRTLMAGIIPGIILAVSFMLIIFLIGVFRPKAIPKLDIQVGWKERFSSTLSVGPVLLIVILVVGGMYLGVFPPTMGGVIGSAGVLIVIAFRRVNRRVIMNSFYESVILNAQLFPLIISGFLFARFIGLSGLPNFLLEIIVDANLSPYVLMFVIIIFYIFIGCVLEFLSMGIITLPIIYPLLVGVGFDPTAIIIILILLAEIAVITPPIGMSAFLVSSITGVRPEIVFRGILPFFFVCILLLVLLIFFPEIATWLPNLLYGTFSG